MQVFKLLLYYILFTYVFFEGTKEIMYLFVKEQLFLKSKYKTLKEVSYLKYKIVIIIQPILKSVLNYKAVVALLFLILHSFIIYDLSHIADTLNLKILEEYAAYTAIFLGALVGYLKVKN